ncbi:nitroreductase family protein [Actinoplanes sp. NPDC049596]|uniref:nitroreductase family protein n=1 Tax=unclassified Actinoplanes TaxID=2626549 RepID=UPI00342D34A9
MDTYTETDLWRAAEAGIRAPSMHNSQPWLFRLRDGAIDILADPRRRLSVADERGWATRIACGAATFNARLALAVHASRPVVELLPDPGDPDLIARLRPGPEPSPSPDEAALYGTIARRHSNRRPFRPDPVPPEIRSRLLEAARAESVWLDLLVGTVPLAGFAQIAASADRVLRRDPAYRSEASAAFRGGWLRPVPGRAHDQEPLIAVLGTYADRPADQIGAGQALQRILLTLTDAGLAGSMMSQPIEVPAARDQLRRSLGRYGAPQMTFRIGYGEPGGLTPRRPLHDVLLSEVSSPVTSGLG